MPPKITPLIAGRRVKDDDVLVGHRLDESGEHILGVRLLGQEQYSDVVEMEEELGRRQLKRTSIPFESVTVEDERVQDDAEAFKHGREDEHAVGHARVAR